MSEHRTYYPPLDNFMNSLANIHQYPRKILYNTDFWSPSPHTKDYQAIVDEFVKVLETFLNVSKTTFSMRGQWEQNPPPQAEGRSLDDYLDGVQRPSIIQSFWQYGNHMADHLLPGTVRCLSRIWSIPHGPPE